MWQHQLDLNAMLALNECGRTLEQEAAFPRREIHSHARLVCEVRSTKFQNKPRNNKTCGVNSIYSSSLEVPAFLRIHNANAITCRRRHEP